MSYIFFNILGIILGIVLIYKYKKEEKVWYILLAGYLLTSSVFRLYQLLL
jgi:uncharacterized membrane protein HdeD (DUF308 family)